MGRFARLVGLLVLVSGCSEAAVTTAKRPPDPDLDAGSAVKLESVLGFDVHVPSASAAFVRAYAGATEMPVREDGAEVVAGPFLSRFEAQLVAGCGADGAVRLHDAFDEPATTEPFVGAVPRADRSAVEVGTRRIFGERFALVTWKLAAPADAHPDAVPVRAADTFERELFAVHGAAPRSIARLPSDFSLDMPAAGLFAARVGASLVFLSPATKDRDDASRAERLVAWRDESLGRELQFERGLVALAQPKGGVPIVTVTRVRPASSALVLASHRVELAPTEAAAGRATLFNDWASPSWVGEDRQDLCRFVGATKVSEETVSLE